MNNDTRNRREVGKRPALVLRLAGRIPPESRAGSAFGAWHRRVWFGIVVAALCVSGVFGFMRTGNHGEQKNGLLVPAQTTNLLGQLRSLRQSDLIQFADGRIWYVRNVHGDNLEVVGWIGDNLRVEDIPSFVLSGDQLSIVRKSDPAWPSARDKYFTQ